MYQTPTWQSNPYYNSEKKIELIFIPQCEYTLLNILKSLYLMSPLFWNLPVSIILYEVYFRVYKID